MATWLDPQLVADHLGQAAPDDRITRATEAAERWVEERRSLTDPLTFVSAPDVIQGAIIYAGLLVQARAQGQGFPGFDDLGAYGGDIGAAMSNVYRLVGSDPVIA